MTSNNNKVYYIAGVWDLFHVGHLNAIKKARKIAGSDTLIVGVVTDSSAKEYKGIVPIISYSQRKAIIEILSFPDQVVKQNVQFSVEQMKKLKVDAVLLGDDWRKKMPTRLKRMSSVIKIIYLPRTKRISSFLIKKKIICEAIK